MLMNIMKFYKIKVNLCKYKMKLKIFLKTIYKMRALSTSSVYAVNLSLSVIGEL